MTELQIGLIALGATAVVGVFGYNKWQESRHRKLAEAVLQPDHDDVLLGDAPKITPASAPESKRSEPEIRNEAPAPELNQRVEPVIAVEADAELVLPFEKSEPIYAQPPLREEPVATSSREPIHQAQSMESIEPVFASALDADLPELTDIDEASEVPLELLDPRTELIMAMELVEPVSAQQILQSQREALQQVSKPVHWVGFNERTREWQRLAPESEMPLRRLRVGLQLVNRLGPVSDAELAVFAGAMQVLADELMAVAVMPSTRVRDQANELDAFCAAVDLEIGVNLISKGPAFSGTKIRALAEAAGMVLGVDGLFTRYDDNGRALFCLQNFETSQFAAESIRSMATHGLTFLLDVPRVDHGERVFMQMTELAKRFAETLQGALVDDNRAPLGEPQLDHIRREFVGKPQASMASFGLPAGSPQALRLFS